MLDGGGASASNVEQDGSGASACNIEQDCGDAAQTVSGCVGAECVTSRSWLQSCCASGDVKTAQHDCAQSFAIKPFIIIIIIIIICHCLFIDACSLVIVVVYGGCGGFAIVITMWSKYEA